MSWRANLRRASFRGVPFFVQEELGKGGRAIVVHRFPLAEEPKLEDLGRDVSRFTVTGYVIGEDYQAARDALIAACKDVPGVGSLVLPLKGELQVRCESVTWSESLREGGICAFDISFVEESSRPAPRREPDQLRLALRQVGEVLRVARIGYALFRAARGDIGGFIRDATLSWLTGEAEGFARDYLGLPGLDLSSARLAVRELLADDATDPSRTATRATAPYQALAAAPAVAAATPAVTGSGAAELATASRDDAADPGALGALLLARAGLPALVDPDDTARLADLARDAAAAAAAQALVEAAWSNADAVLAARDWLARVLEERIDVAADRGAEGDDELIIALRALSVQCRRHLTDTAARLPRRIAYAMPGPLPALALAQRLHADAGRAAELVALNAPRHPAFMPLAGVRLRP
jgi:prophage DNA circulation protein